MTRLDRVASVSARIGWKALTASEYVPEGYVFLSTPNIKSDPIDFENVNYITQYRYDESPELKLRVGDVLLVKDGNTLGITNIVRHLPGPATVNGSIAVIRVSGMDPAFLRYVLASSVTQSLISSLKDGMGVPHLFQRDINRLPIPLPPLDEQHRIASFLDVESARIDRLIELEERLAALAREQLVARREEILVAGVARRVPLQHLTDPHRPIVYGIVQAGEEVPDGVPYIKTGDLNSLDPAMLSRCSPDIDRSYRRARVRPGDLVIAMRASIGLAVKVPTSLPVANLTQGTARIAPGQGVDLNWLYHVIRTVTVQEQCQARAVGSTYRTLNIWDLRRIEIPTPRSGRMAGLGAEVEALTGEKDRLESLLQHKKDLLAERRSALITAAVAGELDVATARGAA